jgi:hypothetical protein
MSACFEGKYETSAFITTTILLGEYQVNILDSTAFKVIPYDVTRGTFAFGDDCALSIHL